MTDQPVDVEQVWTDPVSPGSDLGAIDWRFLLPEAHLGRVGVDGVTEQLHGDALALWATVVRRVDDDTAAVHDTIVLSDPSRSEVEAAVTSLATPGTIRIGSIPPRHRRQRERELRAQGFEVGSWWERPTGRSPWCLVSLDERQGAATILRTVAGRGRRAHFEAAAARCGLAHRWGREVTLVARRPGPGGAIRHAVAAPGPNRSVAALITPRFAASRAVVGISLSADGRRLDRVVKVARSSIDDPAIEAEHHALATFAVLSTNPAAAPGHHQLVRHGDRTALVEDAAPGTPLARSLVRRDPAAALRLGLTWLDGVPVGPRSRLGQDGRAADLLHAPLRAVASLRTDQPDRRHGHLEQARDLLDPLMEAELPLVFEHGDLSHPNLFVTPGRSLVVIDWERARTDGLPLQDLIFYLGYIAESLDRPRGPDEMLASARRTFHTGGWARPDIDLCAERMEIDQRLVPLLELACWTRAMARLAEPGALPRPSDGHRYEAQWIASIERAEAWAR